MGTDLEWEKWGEKDPYYAVLTDPKFRTASLDDAALDEFFDSGRQHAEYVVARSKDLRGSSYAPSRVLDFGCGVGRMLVPFARFADEVVGVDVSRSMLEQARLNCERAGCTNVRLVVSDDSIAAAVGRFDLVHSSIVLQHIDVSRGRRFFERLVDLVAPGGVAAVQVTYACARYPATYGQPPQPTSSPAVPASDPLATVYKRVRDWLPKQTPTLETFAPPPAVGTDPEMLMNHYNLGELAYMIQRSGAKGFQADFTDHGGVWGVTLFFGPPDT